MIGLDIQLFAKSAAYQTERRKANAHARGREIQEEIKREEEKQSKTERKSTAGEAVTAVNMRETYAIYRIENGKEIPVMKDGVAVTRTGQQVLDKMRFNKRRGVWENSHGRSYRVRKIKK